MKAATIAMAILTLVFLLVAIWVRPLTVPAAMTAGLFAIATTIVGGLAADPHRKKD